MEKVSIEQEVINRIRSANSILLTVGQNPTVDDLAALSGFSLGLKQLDKKVIALFSGQLPDKLRFLGPKFSQNTNKMRDFVILLDTGKVEKVRVKNEDNKHSIYVSPKGDFSQADLKFELGELKTDLVLVMGAADPNDLDKAIIDGGVDPAKVVFFNLINASSYSEMITELSLNLGVKIDTNIANYLMTGIITATEQFANEKTSAKTFQIAAKLLKFGADQQLIIENLANTPLTATVPEPNFQVSGQKPINTMNNVSYEDLLSMPVDSMSTVLAPPPTPEEPISQPTNEIYHNLDLTIPPTPQITHKSNLKQKKMNIEKLPRPEGVDIVDLPPPPPAPDFGALEMPPNLDFSAEMAPPPNTVDSPKGTQNTKPHQVSNLEQFQIPG